jgi:hypothetical protein
LKDKNLPLDKALVVQAKLNTLNPSKSKDAEMVSASVQKYVELSDMFASSPLARNSRPTPLAEHRKPSTASPTNHGFDRLPQSALLFVAITGSSASDVAKFLAKANNNAQLAIKTYQEECWKSDLYGGN